MEIYLVHRKDLTKSPVVDLVKNPENLSLGEHLLPVNYLGQEIQVILKNYFLVAGRLFFWKDAEIIIDQEIIIENIIKVINSDSIIVKTDRGYYYYRADNSGFWLDQFKPNLEIKTAILNLKEDKLVLNLFANSSRNCSDFLFF